MAEIMNYVDEQDQVIGQEAREEIKIKKLNYRVVHIWIFDEKDNLLICRRPLNNKDYAGKWTSSAGGHVKAGEDYQTAAFREAEEELGIRLELNHAFKLNYSHPRGNKVFIDLWVAKNPSNLRDLKLDIKEIRETRFISLDSLSRVMIDAPESFNPQFIQMVERWQSLLKEK